MYCSAQFGYLDDLQRDLDATRPDLEIQILGVNPFGEESGNEGVTEGRDIPWLQDVDENGDRITDNWLETWPFVYRDVVIVDADGIAADSFNLTVDSLEEPESYNSLKQMLIDVATSAIDASDDVVSVLTGTTSEINVLANDGGSSRLSIVDVTTPEFGEAEVATIEYPAHLDPVKWPLTDLVISEIVPDEYIELYNTSFTESVDLASIDHVFVSGQFEADIATLSDASIPARGYTQLDWPAGLEMDSASGELMLYSNRDNGFETGLSMTDYVAWGEVSEHSRIELARQFGFWEGPPDGTLDLAAIQRIPGTIGNESHSYDNHRPSTPGNAINDAVETQQVIRLTVPDSFTGNLEFSYTVMDDAGKTDTALVEVAVEPEANPWQNPVNKLDVNNDGEVTFDDAQAIMDILNAGLAGDLPSQLTMPLVPTPFVDCNGNNSVEARDALLIINYLNRQAKSAADPAQAAAQAIAANLVASQNEDVDESDDG